MADKRYIWDKMAKSFHEMSSRSKVLKDRYLRIADIILEAKPESILNLGCGSGILEDELIKCGYKGKMYAVDASEEMLKLATKLCGDKAVFKKADLDKPLDIDEKFDVIVAMNVMFFLKDKQQFLQTVNRLLRNKNSIFILLNPKPNEESSIPRFIKDHYINTSFHEKIMITLNEISNIPLYWGMIRGQARIWKMSDKGEIIIHNQKDIVELSENARLKIRFFEDYRSSQSWLFVMEKKS